MERSRIYLKYFINRSLPPQSQGVEGSRVVPECDRETLWESLREKQAAQLDRLKKSEPKYELVLKFVTRMEVCVTIDLLCYGRQNYWGGFGNLFYHVI